MFTMMTLRAPTIGALPLSCAAVGREGPALRLQEKHIMRFEKGKQPHVSAFWSLSMYHVSDGSFVENPIKRYSIGGRTPGLVTASDGSLSLYIRPPRCGLTSLTSGKHHQPPMSACGTKRTRRKRGLMSVCRGEPDSTRT